MATRKKKENGDASKPRAVAEEIENLWERVEDLESWRRNVTNAIGILRRRVIDLEQSGESE